MPINGPSLPDRAHRFGPSRPCWESAIGRRVMASLPTPTSYRFWIRRASSSISRKDSTSTELTLQMPSSVSRNRIKTWPDINEYDYRDADFIGKMMLEKTIPVKTLELSFRIDYGHEAVVM